MQRKTIGFAIAISILFLGYVGYKNYPFSSEVVQKSVNENSYSFIVEEFLQRMKKTYPNNFEENIWQHHNELKSELIGAEMDNYHFTDIEGSKLNLHEIGTPYIIEATASWCGPCLESIPVINQLSIENSGQLKFILLAHDWGEKAVKFSKRYNENTKFIASEVEVNAMNPVKLKINKFKNLLSFPTMIFVDKNNVIQNVKVGGMRSGNFPRGNGDTLRISKEEAFQGNRNIMASGIEELIP